MQICVADALRGTHATKYYPGELNVRLADVVLINKVNSLPGIHAAYEQAENLKRLTKPQSPVMFGNSVVRGEGKDAATGRLLSNDEVSAMVRGKRVLVIDDGPTLTHGGMPFGAGFALAKQLEAGEIVNPRPYAKGSLVGVFDKFRHLDCVLPAMGYGDEQIHDLEKTVNAVDCDLVLVATPIDLTRLIDIEKPSMRIGYSLPADDGTLTAAVKRLVS